MANVGQRVFSFVLAMVFLLSACALSAFAIYDQYQERKKSNAQTAAAQQKAANSSAGKSLENFAPVQTVSALESNDFKSS